MLRTSGFMALWNDWPQFGMLSLFVSPQVDFALEGASTKIASERLEAGVFSGMGDEVGRLTEGLSTNRTLMGFLAWKTKIKTNVLLLY